ncbi:alpha/beta hydrolase [Aquimarina sp. TRL1]|uniref:alpha/beta fold hydrolase n=1 Tax=Aquimarina sp. (strain TRL1) TaxID=2736252 RepID=UPI00158D8AA2|nr:alpha/beta hydrolase [Aquimarina sp. TRL1]QKX05110.1 alpha/beta hydrolase [Aquimarina sp. TRL1]
MGNTIKKEIKIGENILEYKEVGQGIPMLFIHGAFSSGNTWRKVIPALASHFRCIIPEWPLGGHKIPVTNNMNLDPEGVADIISAVLEALSINKTILIANDTGGAYAQVFAAQCPQKVIALVLSNCEGFEVFPPKKFASLKTMVKVPGYMWIMAKLFSYKPSLKWDMAFGLLSHQLTKEELYEYYVKNFSENKHIRENFKRLALGWDPKYTLNAAEKLKDFKKPVLLLWGMDDTVLFPVELGKRIASIFPNATFIAVDKAMTYVQEDDPDTFIEGILSFTKEHQLERISEVL